MRRTLLTIYAIGMLLNSCLFAQETMTGYDISPILPLEWIAPEEPDLIELDTSSFSVGFTDPSWSVSLGLYQMASLDTLLYVPVITPQVPEIVAATVNFDPEVLNLASQGKWITCYITLASSYDVTDIDGTTILLNETVSPTWKMIDEEEQILKLKFERAAVQSLLVPGEVELMITGLLTGEILFEGFDSITVMDPLNQ